MLFYKAFHKNGWLLHGIARPDWPRIDEMKEPGLPGLDTLYKQVHQPAPALVMGEWTQVIPGNRLRVCSSGWHLVPPIYAAITTWCGARLLRPRSDRLVYLAEIAEGCTAKFHSDHGDKFVVTEARLVRALTEDERKAILNHSAGWASAVVIGTRAERARLRDGAEWFRAQLGIARVAADAVPTFRNYRPSRVHTVKVLSKEL